MSFSVDDLVASLSSNHIGQEAMDLQALHAQLSQTLFTPMQSRPAARDVPPRCTTPTAGASSSRWPAAADAYHHHPADDAADEAIVEDLLFSAGPASPSATSAPTYPFAPSASRAHGHHPHDDANENAFATSDPFFLAALQAQAQQAAHHQSNFFGGSGGGHQGGFFANAARPAQSSPFMRPPHMHAHDPRTAHGFNAFGQAPVAQPLYAGVGHFGM